MYLRYCGNCLTTNFGAYVCLEESVHNPEAWHAFSANVEAVCSYYFQMMQCYFPTLASCFNHLHNSHHSPSIGNSHTANPFLAFNFTSVAHLDPLDATYAFGRYYVGTGSNSDSVFAFAQFRVLMNIHHGIASMWNTEKALHCTTQASVPYQNIRIGTVIQTNKSLSTKAKKLWKPTKEEEESRTSKQ
jgi:hypothetical protein